MKQYLRKILVAIVATTFALTGCSLKNKEANTKEQDLLAKIQAKGEITVAMEGTWAPWTYHDSANKLVGYDVEVAQLIEKSRC